MFSLIQVFSLTKTFSPFGCYHYSDVFTDEVGVFIDQLILLIRYFHGSGAFTTSSGVFADNAFSLSRCFHFQIFSKIGCFH